MSDPLSETGPRRIPVPWDPSFYILQNTQVLPGDMLKSEYATNAEYGIVDRALSALYVNWEGVQDVPLADDTEAGLMARGNGDPSYYYGGDNAVHSTAPLRGTHWFVGIGNPGTVPGAVPGDLYIDQSTGNYFVLS